MNDLDDARPHLPFPLGSQVDGEVRELRCRHGRVRLRIPYRRSPGSCRGASVRRSRGALSTVVLRHSLLPSLVVSDFQLIIDEEPPRTGARWHEALTGRRLLIAVALAAVEAAVLLAFQPGLLWVILIAAVVLAACAGLIARVGPGLGRDLLMIMGGAQAILVSVPLAIGFGIVVAVVAGILLIAGLVFVAFARRA